MPDKPMFLSPGKMIETVLRLFGFMLTFMGAICLIMALISLLRGQEDFLGGIISGAIMLGLGMGGLKLGKRVGLALDERLSRIGLNTDMGDIEAPDEKVAVYKEKFDVYGGSVERMEVRRKPVDEKGAPVDAYAVQRAYRISDRDRFIVGRNRSLVQFSLGVVFWIIAFFYSNGYKAVMENGPWEFDFLAFIMVLVGIIFTVMGGLDQHVEIDRREGWVKRNRAWFFLRFSSLYQLSFFDHVLIKRTGAETMNNFDSVTSRDDEVGYQVCLCGSELLHLFHFDNMLDARDLAQRVSDYTRFAVKEDL